MHVFILFQLATLLTALPADSLEVSLQRVSRQYAVARSKQDVETLVRLDTEVRHLFIDSFEERRQLAEGNNFKPEYDSIGLRIGHYSEAVEYSGKILVVAHRINPHSPLRNFTLYSTVNMNGDPDGFPNVEEAKTYLEEFPSGPYAFEVSQTLANFYDDLFKTLRDRIAGKTILYLTYDEFITSAPLNEQLNSAQRNGLFYYRMALNIRPKNPALQESYEALKNGSTQGWYFIND